MATPFRLTAEQFDALHAMGPADRALMLANLAQAHHHRVFNIIGKYCSLDGIPQLREWERRGEELTAEATAEYQRLADLEADLELTASLGGMMVAPVGSLAA